MISWRHYRPVGFILGNGGSIFLCLFLYSHWLSIFTCIGRFSCFSVFRALLQEKVGGYDAYRQICIFFFNVHYNYSAFEWCILQGDKGTALQTKSERVFAATSAVFCWSHRQETTFFIFVCSEIDCAFFTEHKHNDKTQSPFVVLWVIMTLSFLKKHNWKNNQLQKWHKLSEA